MNPQEVVRSEQVPDGSYVGICDEATCVGVVQVRGTVAVCGECNKNYGTDRDIWPEP